MTDNILTRNNPFKQATTSATIHSSNNFVQKYINWDNYQLPLIFCFSLLSLNYFNMKLLKYIVQYFLDKSVITINSTKVADPTERSIRMVCESTVSSSSPLNSSVHFEGPVQLGFVNLEGETQWFGESEMPVLNMKAGGPMNLELPLHVIFKDTKKFGEFNKILMLQKSLKMVMKGFVTVRMLGFLKVKGVLMSKAIEIKGMDGLNQVSIKDVIVKKGDRAKIEIAVSCKMTNVSDISMTLDQVWFNMYFKDIQVGTVSISPLNLAPGINSPPTRVFFHPDPNNVKAVEMGRELMSNFTKGVDSETTIKGNHPNKQLPTYFAEGLSGLNITTTLNGLDIPLVKSAKMSISPLDLVISMAAFSVPTRLMTTNPFDEDFYIVKISSDAIIKGVNIGSLNADHSSYPIKVARRTTVETGLMTMKLNPLVEGFGAVATTLGEGNMTTDIKATIDAKVGNYSMVLDYEQKAVPVIIGL